MSISRAILSTTAVLAGAAGLAALFAPDEILRALTTGGAAAAMPPAAAFVLQLCGGALFGFAMLNWAARGTKVGGIYGRPLALGNLVQWGAGAATWTHLWRAGVHAPAVVAATLVWLACTCAFGYLMFFHDPV